MIGAIVMLLALAGAPLDSQVVLERYASHLVAIDSPKTLIFSYTVSQAGPRDIEQTHRVYRSGDLVRDETLSVDGQTLKSKVTHIGRYRNHYTIDGLAPRLTQYAFLFVRAVKSGNSYDYAYRAEALSVSSSFVVEGMTINGRTYLPSEIRFRTSRGTVDATGTVGFAQAGKYWVPTAASVEATINGKPAREHITFSAYQFPESLPKSTFQAPKPLPTPALPTF